MEWIIIIAAIGIIVCLAHLNNKTIRRYDSYLKSALAVNSIDRNGFGWALDFIDGIASFADHREYKESMQILCEVYDVHLVMDSEDYLISNDTRVILAQRVADQSQRLLTRF